MCPPDRRGRSGARLLTAPSSTLALRIMFSKVGMVFCRCDSSLVIDVSRRSRPVCVTSRAAFGGIAPRRGGVVQPAQQRRRRHDRHHQVLAVADRQHHPQQRMGGLRNLHAGFGLNDDRFLSHTRRAVVDDP